MTMAAHGAGSRPLGWTGSSVRSTSTSALLVVIAAAERGQEWPWTPAFIANELRAGGGTARSHAGVPLANTLCWNRGASARPRQVFAQWLMRHAALSPGPDRARSVEPKAKAALPLPRFTDAPSEIRNQRERNMNQRVFLTWALPPPSSSECIADARRQTQAQPLPLDECISVGDSSPRSRLCMHEFSDHSKCVVAVTPGKEFASTQLSCKIL
jgi:hypothetical protein